MKTTGRLLCAAFVFSASTAHALEGKARIIDGDTIEIAGQYVRLHGIDAPERGQTCGKAFACGREATAALVDMIGGEAVACEATGWDRYGRVIGICRAGNVEINQFMVAAGWAIAYRQYSTDYVDEEDEARKLGRGMWAGEFVSPAEWRRGVRTR